MGDIIISFNYMDDPKNLTNKEFIEKTVKIFIHGFLHLLGYDHINDIDYKKMQTAEKNIFNKVKKLLNTCKKPQALCILGIFQKSTKKHSIV